MSRCLMITEKFESRDVTEILSLATSMISLINFSEKKEFVMFSFPGFRSVRFSRRAMSWIPEYLSWKMIYWMRPALTRSRSQSQRKRRSRTEKGEGSAAGIGTENVTGGVTAGAVVAAAETRHAEDPEVANIRKRGMSGQNEVVEGEVAKMSCLLMRRTG